MTPTFIDSVLRGAEALAARDAVGTLADPDLVRRFAADRDPAAFAVLVRRHGPLVWGVCRNLLPADADAEDAFQATFLALVRSAGSVRRAETLGAWLHGVAYRVAMKARRAAARRRQREQIAAVPEPDNPVPDAAWDELQAAVHEEVCRLPEKLRLPFVLCGLQGRQQKDVARQLGWKVGTVSGRLTRARQRLLDRLARRGVPVGVAAGAAVLGLASGGAAVPNAVCLKALAAAKDPAAASPIVLSLARGVTSMSLTRTKLLAAAVLVAGALTTGIGSRVVSTADAQAPPANNRDAQSEQIKKALEFLATAQAKERWEYKFIPVEKALSTADLQKVLGTADQEGWQYCGSQTLLADGKKGEAVPHMVFKRPKAGAAAADTSSSAAAFYAALAQKAQAENDAAKAEKMAQMERYYRTVRSAQSQAEQDVAKARAQAAEADYARAVQAAQDADSKARQQALDQERAKRLYADQLDAAKRAADEERTKAKDLEKMIQKLRAEQEELQRRMKELEGERGAKKQAGVDPRANTETLTVTLKHVKARDAAQSLAKQFAGEDFQVRSDNSTNTLYIQGRPEVLAKVRDAVAKAVDVPQATPTTGDANSPVTVRVPLANVDGKTAAADLARILPATKVVAEVHPKAIVLAGPPQVVDEARDAILKIDGKQPADPAAGDQPENFVLKPRYASTADLQAVLDKVFRGQAMFTAEPRSNSLIITARAAVLAEVKKLVEVLDVEPGKP
jgi:RNA polymerase sigma factor (sigma-70 family)